MIARRRRGVTRGYVAGLISAMVVVALALLIVSWSGISWLTGGEVVSTPAIPVPVVPVAVVLLLATLAWGLWAQTIVLLKGRLAPAWVHILLVSVGSYLLWGLIGLAAGMSVGDTWLSLYACALAVVWALVSLLCWAVLARRVYTDRPTPQWPWERNGDLGPDWANTESDPWRSDSDDDGGFHRGDGGDGGDADDGGGSDDRWNDSGRDRQ